MSAQFVQPNGRFQTEGNGYGGLTVRSSQHNRVPLSLGHVGTHRDEVAQFFSEQHDAVSELQRHGCVHDVVGRGSEVDAPPGFPGCLGHGLGQRHDVVPRFCFDFTNTLFGDGLGICNRSDSVVVVFGDSVQLPVRPNQGSLNLELTFMTTDFRPNALEILVSVTVIQRTEGHAPTLTARFINLPTEPYGDG